eukprot:symbB.v1.2.012775.t1/scaffold888.1/size154975/12
MAWHEEKREASSGFISPPHSGDESGEGGGHSGLHFSREGNRRLSGVEASPVRSTLQDLLDLMPGSEAAVETPRSVNWPSFFEPRVLACGAHGLAALTPRGVGALIHGNAAHRFHLAGLTHLPPLLSAAFHPHSKELMVVSRQGHVASCPEPSGVTQCRMAQNLPVPLGTRLVAAAAGWLRSSQSEEPHLHVAFIDEALPEMIAIFKHRKAEGIWHPLGELPVPSSGKVSLAFSSGELLLSTEGGLVQRRRLEDGALLDSATHKWGRTSPVAQWQGACPVGEGLAHLRLLRAGEAWVPELLMKNTETRQRSGRPAIFQ